MRLLNTRTLRLKDFISNVPSDYAILSHTWAENEVTYKDMQSFNDIKPGESDSVHEPIVIPDEVPIDFQESYRKIANSCRLARTQGYQYVWIDTCCINKDSSAELSEAINSMYKWYEAAAICHVYLTDYDEGTAESSEGELREEAFGACRWFTRGWTLQELIAPRHVEFYDRNWTYVGNKDRLVDLLTRITHIDFLILNAEPSWKSRALRECSVASKFSWAARRTTTTRREDEAYALLGLFDINMPLLYGEGAKAFQRLQENIIAQTTDHWILLWRPFSLRPQEEWWGKLLAPSPVYFLDCASVVSARGEESLRKEFRLTKGGIEMSCLIVETAETYGWSAVLDCRYRDDPSGLILLPLQRRQLTQFDTRLIMARDIVLQLRAWKTTVPPKDRRFTTLDVWHERLPLTASGYCAAGKEIKDMLLVAPTIVPRVAPEQLPQRFNVIVRPSTAFLQAFQLVKSSSSYNSETQAVTWTGARATDARDLTHLGACSMTWQCIDDVRNETLSIHLHEVFGVHALLCKAELTRERSGNEPLETLVGSVTLFDPEPHESRNGMANSKSTPIAELESVSGVIRVRNVARKLLGETVHQLHIEKVPSMSKAAEGPQRQQSRLGSTAKKSHSEKSLASVRHR